jgi:hypothetical protein
MWLLLAALLHLLLFWNFCLGPIIIFLMPQRNFYGISIFLMPASWQFTILSTRLVRVPLLLQRIWFRQIRVAFCLVPLMFIMQFVIIFCVWQVRMPKLQAGFLLMRVPFLAALSSGFKNHLLTGDCISCGHNVSPPVGLCLILATLPLAICMLAVPSLFIMPVAEPSTSVLLEC